MTPTLCVMATAGKDGAMLDASPRGGPPGFVKCTDAQHLLLPDAGGNNRLDSLEGAGSEDVCRLIPLGSKHRDAPPSRSSSFL